MLHAVAVPPASAGGQTLWANCFAAFRALPETLQEDLKARWMVHWDGFHPGFNGIASKGLAGGSGAGSAVAGKSINQISGPPVTHPVVREHTDGLASHHGRHSLYLSAMRCEYVGGMGRGEGHELLRALLEHATRPEFVSAPPDAF